MLSDWSKNIAIGGYSVRLNRLNSFNRFIERLLSLNLEEITLLSDSLSLRVEKVSSEAMRMSPYYYHTPHVLLEYCHVNLIDTFIDVTLELNKTYRRSGKQMRTLTEVPLDWHQDRNLNLINPLDLLMEAPFYALCQEYHASDVRDLLQSLAELLQERLHHEDYSHIANNDEILELIYNRAVFKSIELNSDLLVELLEEGKSTPIFWLVTINGDEIVECFMNEFSKRMDNAADEKLGIPWVEDDSPRRVGETAQRSNHDDLIQDHSLDMAKSLLRPANLMTLKGN